MSSNYKLSFWDIQAGPGDIGAATRAQIAKAALSLQNHPDVLFSSSAGGYDDSEAPEIALLIPVDYSPHNLLPSIERAIVAEGLISQVSLKSDVRYYTLEDDSLASIERAAYVPDEELAREQIEALVDLPRTADPAASEIKPLVQQLIECLSTLNLAEWFDPAAAAASAAAPPVPASSFPASALFEEISVSEDKYLRMKKARGDAISQEVSAINETLEVLQKETNTNSAVLEMIKGGLVTLGKKMWEKYGNLKSAGSIGTMISALIASAGGIHVVAAVAAVIAISIGILWVILKPCVNELIFINATASEISLNDDYVMNGERDKVTVSISAAPPKTTEKPMAYPCGVYLYSKYTIKGKPVGFYGSTMGMGMKRSSDGLTWSIGMDCPNTITGGTNGVQVLAGDNPKQVAKNVDTKSKETDSIKVGRDTMTVSRAKPLGFINYCIGTVGL